MSSFYRRHLNETRHTDDGPNRSPSHRPLRLPDRHNTVSSGMNPDPSTPCPTPLTHRPYNNKVL